MTPENADATEDLAGPVGSEGTGAAGEPGIEGDGGAAAADATEEQLLGEPKPVGHTVVQDNVSEPGVQHTHQVGLDGEVVATSSHGSEDDDEAEVSDELLLDGAAAKAEAERQGLLPKDDAEGAVESEDALVGAGPGDQAGTGGGDGGGADDEE